MAQAAPDKRQRLVTAAADLFHRRGLSSTSLADVAHRAAVQPGNVYYHFRSKKDLVAAVAQEWTARIDTILAALDRDPDPWQRLAAYIARADRHRIDYADAGCPIAGINRDLRQLGGDGAALAAPAFERQLSWLSDQFVRGGLDRSSADADARFLLATLQGSFVLGQSLGQPALIGTVAERLGDWLYGVRAAAT